MSPYETFADDVSVDTDTESLKIMKDDLFHLLQNSRRRAVLRYFVAHPDYEEFSIRNIAEEIAAWENGISVDELHSNQRQRVYIALYQSHLPKFNKYNIIKYDQSRGIMKPTPLVAVFEPYLASTFHTNAVDQQISTPDDHSSLDLTTIRSLLNR